ncbi:hypothetical protein SAMN06265379_101625 [Saccharicrinis carchari]|uniref:Uncharacterized protein n=1 Tax=Saccharicrinis carchari TaxID=1168039 RepID=A0A521B2K1_SACCC|nr:hypothetical protein SAMN06265379_101625 [Saccharicrinis carchari]
MAKILKFTIGSLGEYFAKAGNYSEASMFQLF